MTRPLVALTFSILIMIASLAGWRYFQVRAILKTPITEKQRLEVARTKRISCQHFSHLCGPLTFGRPSPVIDKTGRWSRSAMAVELQTIQPEVDLWTKLWAYASLKRWHYVSVNHPQYFVAALIVKFSYVSAATIYVVDRQNNHKYYQYDAQMPLGVGTSFSVGPLQDCTTWGQPTKEIERQGRPWIEMCPRTLGDGSEMLRASVPVEGTENGRIRIHLTMEGPGVDSLALVYPVKGDRHHLTYVHKGAGQAVSSGWVQIDDGPKVDVTGGAGGVDWTMGHPSMRTAWRWVSLNDARAQVTYLHTGEKRVERLGINLSDEVYDVLSVTGHLVSAENVIFLDGKVLPLANPVKITMPLDVQARKTSPWTIRSVVDSDTEYIDLTFTPFGAREDHSDFLLVVSDFVQPYGKFQGSLKILHPGPTTSPNEAVLVTLSADAFGVVEDHLAVW